MFHDPLACKYIRAKFWTSNYAQDGGPKYPAVQASFRCRLVQLVVRRQDPSVRSDTVTNINLVTGCSSGIGQALAQLVAKSRNRVVPSARKPSGLGAIPSNDRVLKLELDVTSAPSIDAALRATLEKFGRIDVLVNNAGYTLAGDTESAEDGESRAVFDTNFWGMVDVTKKTLGIFRDENPKTGQQGGVVVNVSSMGGWSGFPGQSFYHASKFAMEGWTESVAKELPTSWNSKCIYYYDP